MQTETQPRQFAKLLTYKGHQALAFLQRDQSEALRLVVQVWSDREDHQVRALIETEHDDQTEVAFDNLTDESLAEFIDASGLGSVAFPQEQA